MVAQIQSFLCKIALAKMLLSGSDISVHLTFSSGVNCKSGAGQESCQCMMEVCTAVVQYGTVR